MINRDRRGEHVCRHRLKHENKDKFSYWFHFSNCNKLVIHLRSAIHLYNLSKVISSKFMLNYPCMPIMLLSFIFLDVPVDSSLPLILKCHHHHLLNPYELIVKVGETSLFISLCWIVIITSLGLGLVQVLE